METARQTLRSTLAAAAVTAAVALTDAIRSRLGTRDTVAPEARADSDWATVDPMGSMWQNVWTGLGGTSKDRLSAHIPTGVYPLGMSTLESLYYGDPIARRIVGAPVAEALRLGFRVVYRGGQATGQDLVPEIETRHRELGLEARAEQAAAMGRLFGFAALLVASDGGVAAAASPLDRSQVRHVDSLTVIDARDLTVTEWQPPGSAVAFPEHRTYTLAHQDLWSQGLVMIDASRVVQFGGIPTPRRDRRNYFQHWDASVLQPVWEVLRRYNANRQTVAYMLGDSSVGVLKLKNLWKVLSSKRRQYFLDQMETIQQLLWSGRIMPISTDEEFERVNRSFEGIPQMAASDQADVAAAAAMPITVLFGRSPAGLDSTGESDLKLWHATVDAERRTRIGPQIEQIIQLLATELGAPDPEEYGIEWPCLEQLSLKERAELEKAVGEADSQRVELGVPAEAILRHRYGGSEYNPSPPLLDDDELEAIEAQAEDEDRRAEELGRRLAEGGGEGGDEGVDEGGEGGDEGVEQGSERGETEPAAAPGEEDDPEVESMSAEEIQAQLKTLEMLVKAKVPAPMTRALLRRIAAALGIESEEGVLEAIRSAELSWYTSPVEGAPGGGAKGEQGED